MTTRTAALLVVTTLSLLAPGVTGPARADGVAAALTRPRPRQYAGVDIIGFLGLLRQNVGSFEVHYERLLGTGGHHGVQLAGDFVHVHQAKSYAQIHQWTFGGSLSWRYYFGGHGVGPFAGVRAGYRQGFGKFEDPEDGSGRIDLENHQLRVLALLGHRIWWPAARLGIVSRLGLGYGRYSVDTEQDRSDVTARDAVRAARDNLGPLPLAVELELSIAWGF